MTGVSAVPAHTQSVHISQTVSVNCRSKFLCIVHNMFSTVNVMQFSAKQVVLVNAGAQLTSLVRVQEPSMKAISFSPSSR